jgi:hypothetical protein
MLTDAEQSSFYDQCAQAIDLAGRSREALLLARLALLLANEVGNLPACERALAAALRDLPAPSMAV